MQNRPILKSSNLRHLAYRAVEYNFNICVFFLSFYTIL